MQRRPPAVVVIGVGNPDRGDDGAGPAVSKQVRDMLATGGLEPPRGVRVLECDGEAVGLIEAWDGAQAAILIDAARSGAPPGFIHRIDAIREAMTGAGFRSSTHAFGVAEAVALARALGRLPSRLVVYGIEGRSFEAGADLCAEVAAAVRPAAARVVADLMSPI